MLVTNSFGQIITEHGGGARFYAKELMNPSRRSPALAPHTTATLPLHHYDNMAFAAFANYSVSIHHPIEYLEEYEHRTTAALEASCEISSSSAFNF